MAFGADSVESFYKNRAGHRDRCSHALMIMLEQRRVVRIIRRQI
jgi:hypothetical protein